MLGGSSGNFYIRDSVGYSIIIGLIGTVFYIRDSIGYRDSILIFRIGTVFYIRIALVIRVMGSVLVLGSVFWGSVIEYYSVSVLETLAITLRVLSLVCVNLTQ